MMKDSPKFSERLAVAIGSAIFAVPLSFLFWYGINLWLWNTDELGLIWGFLGVALFSGLGFTFPRHIGRVFSKAWQLLLNWF